MVLSTVLILLLGATSELGGSSLSCPWVVASGKFQPIVLLSHHLKRKPESPTNCQSLELPILRQKKKALPALLI